MTNEIKYLKILKRDQILRIASELAKKPKKLIWATAEDPIRFTDDMCSVVDCFGGYIAFDDFRILNDFGNASADKERTIQFCNLVVEELGKLPHGQDLVECYLEDHKLCIQLEKFAIRHKAENDCAELDEIARAVGSPKEKVKDK